MKSPSEETLLAAAEALKSRMETFGADFYEIHVVAGSASAFLFQDGVLERLSASSAQGTGLRCFRHGRWFTASVDSVDIEEVLPLAEEVASMHLDESGGLELDFSLLPEGRRGRALLTGEIPPHEVPPGEKVALVKKMAAAIAAADDGRIRNHRVHYSDGGGLRVVAASDGTLVVTGGSRVRLGCSVVARDDEKAQHWAEHIAGPGGFEIVRDASEEELGTKAAKKALDLLGAPSPPGGTMPVILDPSAAGLFIHECLGHSAEADSVLEGHSLLEGKLGQRIGSPLVSIVDDPTFPGAYGYYAFDSEGTPARKTFVVREGVLEEYLHSKETALRMKSSPNGHARHSTYAARPLPRMSNTYIEAGRAKREEMISSLDEGLLLCRGESGHVLSEKGEYTCKVMEGYVIRKGMLEQHVGETSFSGEVLDTLHKIGMVGNKVVLRDPAVCSKEGQGVPVDSGGPHLLVSEVVVSG